MTRTAPALLLALAACTGPEPYERPGTWQATGVNDANLRAMVANPGDLARGVEPVIPSRGERAAIAAGRLAHPSAPPEGTSASPGIPALPSPATLRVQR